MVFAAGLLADAVENLQQLGWLPFGEHVLWSTSRVVAEDSSLGDVAHSLLGYADHPTVLQAFVWVAYLTISLTAFLHLARRSRRPKVAIAPPGGAVDAGPGSPTTPSTSGTG